MRLKKYRCLIMLIGVFAISGLTACGDDEYGEKEIENMEDEDKVEEDEEKDSTEYEDLEANTSGKDLEKETIEEDAQDETTKEVEEEASTVVTDETQTVQPSTSTVISDTDSEPSTTKQTETTKEPETTVSQTILEGTYKVCTSAFNFSAGTSVHDPSIVKDGDTYYIFGSHMAWAKSKDLTTWTAFTNNINTDYKNIFKSNFEWAAMGDSVYDPAGNLWAPDIIYNNKMKKWCMYMSINGCSWNSSIVLLTADRLDGDWTYVGTVIYSGMTDETSSHDFKYTDYVMATGETTLNERYRTKPTVWYDNKVPTASSTWNSAYGAHAIDACVFYDESGTLYMSYGSWSGGIYIIKLDENTGLRDYTYKYAYEQNKSDPYMGIKLTGGNSTSGEASYIEYDKESGYYFMYVSYGWLGSNGGYNIRIFRSKNATGPYEDATGTSALMSNGVSTGVKMLGGYNLPCLKNGYIAPGHNSAFSDSDGKKYVVYHTRFENNGEWHFPRVHQLITNEKGWLCVLPFQTKGETVSQTGYNKADLVGKYYVVVQKAENNINATNYSEIYLNQDGTVSGAYSGTWSYTSGKCYMQIKIGGHQYYGVFAQMTDEAGNNCMTFSAVGDGTNQTLLGVSY